MSIKCHYIIGFSIAQDAANQQSGKVADMSLETGGATVDPLLTMFNRTGVFDLYSYPNYELDSVRSTLSLIHNFYQIELELPGKLKKSKKL